MLSPEAMDVIVEGISAEICKDNPTPECPVAVDFVLRNGLPLLAGASDDAGFAEVSFEFGKQTKLCILIVNLLFYEHCNFQFHMHTPIVAKL